MKVLADRALEWCHDLKDVYYDGTVAEFSQVELGEEINDDSAFDVIHCTDGDYVL